MQLRNCYIKRSEHEKGYRSKGNKKGSTYAPCQISPVRPSCTLSTSRWRQSKEDKRGVETISEY